MKVNLIFYRVSCDLEYLLLFCGIGQTKQNTATKYLLAFCTVDTLFSSGSCCCGVSLSTQHDHIIPPEHKSTGFPPLSTHEIDNPHSNLRPLYRQV